MAPKGSGEADLRLLTGTSTRDLTKNFRRAKLKVDRPALSKTRTLCELSF